MNKPITLKTYQAFDQSWNTNRSVLIFARDMKEAQKLSLTSSKMNAIPESDISVIHLTHHDFLIDKYKPVEPCVIEEPESCKNCEQWTAPIGEDGFCDNCRKELQEGYIG